MKNWLIEKENACCMCGAGSCAQPAVLQPPVPLCCSTPPKPLLQRRCHHALHSLPLPLSISPNEIFNVLKDIKFLCSSGNRDPERSQSSLPPRGAGSRLNVLLMLDLLLQGS